MNILALIQIWMTYNKLKNFMIDLKTKKNNSIVDKVVVFFLFSLVIFFKSLKTLSELFSYGILKKEILTTKSNLGFDVRIKIK